jgi:hypothetical protein
MATVVVDRALVQAAVVDGGGQTYRVRYRFGKLHADHLDLELPAPASSLQYELLLDGHRVDNLQAVDDSGQAHAGGRILKVPVQPALYQNRSDVVLEVVCQLPPPPAPRMAGWGGWPLQVTFVPPRLRGDALLGRVRWQLVLPGDWLVLAAGGATLEQRWGRRGWLLAPVPAVGGAELEHWFGGPDAAAADEASPADVVAWQTRAQPLRLTRVPQQAWLLACSLVVLVGGLGLYYLPLDRRRFTAVLVLAGLALLTVGVLWPDLPPAVVYGGLPGLGVLLLVFLVQWVLHRRYRRQVVFMPGFTRLKTGSSLIRSGTGSGKRPRGEPSTIDAPQTGGE